MTLEQKVVYPLFGSLFWLTFLAHFFASDFGIFYTAKKETFF
jgi:hypothetical protein